MFVGITNTPRDYAWGSATAIADLLGTTPSGGPEAELWLGTHPGSPSQTADGALSDIATLPFLLKVLAAGSPLSLQAHPTIAQARAGFAAENAADVPLDAATRNYKDELHKPEIIFALTPFRALCGFRPASETAASLERLIGVAPGNAPLNGWLDRLGSDDDIRDCFEWLISRGPGVSDVVAALVSAASLVEGAHYTLIAELAAAYPGDPGIAISLMLNLAELSPGEVLFLPAGNIHAYIEGLGIELMAASDNVLRGGLTPKHVDVEQLLEVLDFTPLPVPFLAASEASPGVQVFAPDIPDFVLTVVTLDASTPTALVEPAGAFIALSTSGSVALTQGENASTLAPGQALYSDESGGVTLEGTGQVFIASTRL